MVCALKAGRRALKVTRLSCRTISLVTSVQAVSVPIAHSGQTGAQAASAPELVRGALPVLCRGRERAEWVYEWRTALKT